MQNCKVTLCTRMKESCHTDGYLSYHWSRIIFSIYSHSCGWHFLRPRTLFRCFHFLLTSGFLSEFRTSPHRSRHRASRRLFGCDARCHRSMTNGAAVTTARPPSQPDPSRWSLEGDIPAYHHAPPTLRVLRRAAFTYVVDQTNAAQPPPTSAANSWFNI